MTKDKAVKAAMEVIRQEVFLTGSEEEVIESHLKAIAGLYPPMGVTLRDPGKNNTSFFGEAFFGFMVMKKMWEDYKAKAGLFLDLIRSETPKELQAAKDNIQHPEGYNKLGLAAVLGAMVFLLREEDVL